MSSERTIRYYNEVYKTIADLYVIDRLTIPKACAKIGITKQTYYKICKKLGYQSVTTYKDARVNFISSSNNIDEHDSVNKLECQHQSKTQVISEVN